MRYIAGIFIVFSALGALMEGGGLSRGVMNSPDMRPQLDGKTKFSDVKGVDEAKVGTLMQSSFYLQILRYIVIQLQLTRYPFSTTYSHSQPRRAINWYIAEAFVS